MLQNPTVTAADIARLAAVGRAAVSNWRKRYPDFPAPTGGTAASPEFDLAQVETWLREQGKLPEASAQEQLWRRVASAGDRQVELLAAVGEFLLARQRGESPPEPDPSLADLLRDAAAVADEHGTAEAFDELLRQFAETPSGRTRATVDDLSELMVDLAGVAGGSMLDPACGIGRILRAATRAGSTAVYGQEIDEPTARVATLWLDLHGQPGEVRVGDSLRADAYAGLTVDAVVCGTPIGATNWGQEELGYDPRWEYGVPPRTEPELAWVQHALAHLRVDGSAVMLMPPAAASRRAGRRIRAELLRRGALRAVIALPARAAATHAIPLHLWVLSRPAPDAPAPAQVLLIELAEADDARAKQYLRAGETYRRFAAQPTEAVEEPGFARAVPTIELVGEDVDLAPGRHVLTAPVAPRPGDVVETARALGVRLERAAEDLAGISGAESWAPTNGEPRVWRSAAVDDLLRGGALTLFRASPAGRGTTAGAAEPKAAEETGPRTLTAGDVAANRPASGATDERLSGGEIEIQPGDVIFPELLRDGSRAARVADARDAGQLLGRHLYLLRPDPERLDPWFLAGFLGAEDNVNAAATGTSIVRVDARRLRVPLLPLSDQRRYGKAFRQLNALRAAAEIATGLVEETASTIGAGLTSGVLLPPDDDPASS